MVALVQSTLSPFAEEFRPASCVEEPVCAGKETIAAPPGLDMENLEDDALPLPPPGLSAPPGLCNDRVADLEAEGKRLQEENLRLMNQRLELESQRLARENEMLRASLAARKVSSAATPPGVWTSGPPGVWAPQGPPGMWMAGPAGGLSTESWIQDAWCAEKSVSDDDTASTAALSGTDESPFSASEGESDRSLSFNVGDAA